MLISSHHSYNVITTSNFVVMNENKGEDVE